MEIKQYTTLKFKCSKCNEGQYYSLGEAIKCPYCDSADGQVLTEVEGNADVEKLKAAMEQYDNGLITLEELNGKLWEIACEVYAAGG